MKARVFQLDSDPHRAAQTLLPWYGNATLDAEERVWFEAHLGECPRCQADVEFQRHLQALPAAVPAGAADRGWLALRARLDAKPAADIRPATSASGWAMRWLPLALGLQAVLVLVLATAWLARAATRRVPHPRIRRERHDGERARRLSPGRHREPPSARRCALPTHESSAARP